MTRTATGTRSSPAIRLPVDKTKMRDQRLELYELPDYTSRKNKANDYGFDPQEQAKATYTGMGSDINVHDQWAVESMGPIQDRTNEHLGQSDKAIVLYRRLLRQEIEKVAGGEKPMRFSTRPMRKAFRDRRPWTASARPRAGRCSGWKQTSNAAAARPGPRPCPRTSAGKVQSPDGGRNDWRPRHSGMARKRQTRNLEIPGSMLCIAPE